MKDQVQISVCLDTDVYDSLQRTARREGKSADQLVRELVDQRLRIPGPRTRQISDPEACSPEAGGV